LIVSYGAILARQPNVITATALAHHGSSDASPARGAGVRFYTHIVTVVPYTGKGTYGDPKRPMHLPAALASSTNRTGILAFACLPSDEGKFAIVESGGANKGALQETYSDATPAGGHRTLLPIHPLTQH
jgi:hypothetical protein